MREQLQLCQIALLVMVLFAVFGGKYAGDHVDDVAWKKYLDDRLQSLVKGQLVQHNQTSGDRGRSSLNADGGWKVVGFFRGNGDWDRIPQRWTSQVGQDKTIVDIFQGKRGGYFVDLASNDAVSISNTLTLEQEYGWNGLCIEPNQNYFAGLLKRKCKLAVAVATGKTGDRVPFAMRGGLGGIVGKEFDNNQPKGSMMNFTTVSITKIFEDFQVPKVVDYLSLDIEGAEYYTFKDFPWDRYKFLTMTVERPKKLAPILEKNGYVYVKTHGGFGDRLYVHKSFPDINRVLEKHGQKK
eukprot:31362-Hanusia_phi.AAC.1